MSHPNEMCFFMRAAMAVESLTAMETLRQVTTAAVTIRTKSMMKENQSVWVSLCYQNQVSITRWFTNNNG